MMSKSAKLATILENMAMILDNKFLKTAVLTLVTFMTSKMTLKPKIDNDIHVHNFGHPMND